MNEMVKSIRRVVIGTAAAAFAVTAVGGTGASIISATHSTTQAASASHVVAALGKWGS